MKTYSNRPPVRVWWMTVTRTERSFSTLTDQAPLWLKTAVREAHQGKLPDDWVYGICRQVCEELIAHADGPPDSDQIHEFADSLVEVYTSEVYDWAAGMCNSTLFATAQDEWSDCSSPDNGPDDPCTWLKQIQFFAIRAIVQTICDAFERNWEADENA